jgi:hypothetical protein
MIFFKKIMRSNITQKVNADNNLKTEEVFDLNVLPCDDIVHVLFV